VKIISDQIFKKAFSIEGATRF